MKSEEEEKAETRSNRQLKNTAPRQPRTPKPPTHRAPIASSLEVLHHPCCAWESGRFQKPSVRAGEL